MNVQTHRVAILVKDGIVGLISLRTNVPAGDSVINAVASVDLRCPPGKQIYRASHETAAEATAAFYDNIAISRDRGWTVAYNGRPLYG